MRVSTRGLILAVVQVAAVHCCGQDGVGTSDRRLDRFKRADRNRDGKLQRDELRGRGRREEPVPKMNELQMPAEPRHTAYLDIRYDSIDGVDANLLSLDLYVPEDNLRKRPVLVMIHGGGWRHGDKRGGAVTGAKLRHFVARGYIFGSINYRLTSDDSGNPGVQHPVHARDCAKAVSWIHDHIAEYGGDPDRIHLIGHSAGAHLAAIIGTNERFLGADGKKLSILKSNVLLDTAAIDIPPANRTQAGPTMVALYEQAFGTNAANRQDASPLRHVAPGKHIPPTLIFHGGDRMNLDKTALAFAKALSQAGAPSQAVDVGDLSHAEINAYVGMIGDPMTELIARLHAGEDATTFPTGLDYGSAPQEVSDATTTNTLFSLACVHPGRIAQASALVDAFAPNRWDIAVACKRRIHLIRNLGNSFEHAWTEETENSNGWGLHDFNGDGRMDLFVAQRDAGFDSDVRVNLGNGKFESRELGNETRGCTRNVLFADFNGDGFIDSYHSVSSFGTNHFGNEMHLGGKDGRFGPDIVETLLDPPVPDFWYKQSNGPDGCTGKWANKMFKGAVVRDFDGDGRPDIVTAAYADRGFQDPRNREYGRRWVEGQFRGIFILHNRSTRDRTAFSEVAGSAIGPDAYGPTRKDWNAYAVVPLDYDRDGDLDLFVGAVLRKRTRDAYEDTRAVALYENRSKPGTIKFCDVTERSGFGRFNELPVAERAKRNFASGAQVDYDNDGWVDLVFVNRRDTKGTPFAYPHVFRNMGDGTFAEVPREKHGLGGGGGRDLAYGDLNGDGRVDLVINDGTAGGYEGADNTRVYLNTTRNGNHWVQIKVTANEAGSPAIGTKVRVYEAGTNVLIGHDEVRTDFCYRSKRAPVLHFGLGAVRRIDVVIEGRAGTTRRCSDLPVDRLHTVSAGRQKG